MEGRPAPGGFTLIEVVITMVVISAVILGVGYTIFAVHGSAARLEGDQIGFGEAQTIVDTLLTLRLGRPTEAMATDDQVMEVLDSDTWPGEISLHQVAKACPLTFELDGFPVPGLWRIEVDSDLNRDGDTDDACEGRPDLLRISVFHDEVELLTVIRAGGFAPMEPGEANPLYSALPPGDTAPSAADVAAGTAATVEHLGFLTLYTGVWVDAARPANPGFPDVGAVR